MELRLPHMLHLLNVFRENGGKENCAKVFGKVDTTETYHRHVLGLQAQSFVGQ